MGLFEEQERWFFPLSVREKRSLRMAEAKPVLAGAESAERSKAAPPPPFISSHTAWKEEASRGVWATIPVAFRASKRTRSPPPLRRLWGPVPRAPVIDGLRSVGLVRHCPLRESDAGRPGPGSSPSGCTSQGKRTETSTPRKRGLRDGRGGTASGLGRTPPLRPREAGPAPNAHRFRQTFYFSTECLTFCENILQ